MKNKLWYIVGGVIALLIIIFLVRNGGKNHFFDEGLQREVTSRTGADAEATMVAESAEPKMTIDENKMLMNELMNCCVSDLTFCSTDNVSPLR